jgi:hypothetical protein
MFSGGLRDVVAKFRQVRSRQLVVLGDPGAGKSVLAMLFTLGLLADRRDGDPVPVLLPLASWNPHREHLRHWLATKLVEDYPGLGNKAVYGADAATRLVSDRKIVPVLDGLDEIPPALHGAAIDALDRAVADGSPLVVTCRGTEYEQAVTHSGSLLARAADLAWWRLDRMMPRHVAGLYLGLPPAPLFAATGWVAAGPVIGLIYGLSFGLAGWLAHTIGERPGPLRVELRFHRTTRRFLWRFLVGAVAGSLLGLGWSLSPPIIALLAVVFGLAIAVHVWLGTPIDASTVTSPATVLRNDRTAALTYTLSFMLCLGPFEGIAFAFTNETQFVPVLAGHFDLLLALATGLACVLLGRFMLSTAGSIAYGLAGAVVGGQVFPRATSATQAIIAGILFGLAVGLAVCLTRAWGAFTMTRLWLAVRGRLPLAIMDFLADAHRRGVLRQVGAAYQFRHVRLQDRLASQTETTARS